MKRVSDGGEPAVVIPPVVEPIQIQLALVVPVVEIRHIAVTIAILPDRANIQNTIYATAP